MVSAELIKTYFPQISESQFKAFERLQPIYLELNERINLISRKDFDNFYVHHVLHSLALAKMCEFPDGARVIDIGTGGGFPGIPLAIIFPNVQFILVDSIGKKIRAVQEVVDILDLQNVNALNNRTESLNIKFDIAVARAVAPMLDLWQWTLSRWNNKALFYLLKGGDLTDEIKTLQEMGPKLQVTENAISEIFSESFFETKKVIRIQG
jgi:16S rRNA (guanine527-N7)-methyltransferase